ncbi:MAG: hypothetical protein ACP5HK_05410 [Acidilobus sp.]
MGRAWRPKGEAIRCGRPDDCLKACAEGKVIVLSAEGLLKIADKLPRNCVALVEAG